MKLKFSIQYHTDWGQSLCVFLSHLNTRGEEKRQLLMMLTEDGDEWNVETVIRESQESETVEISYNYAVVDADGNVQRREWSIIPRTYHVDGTKDYFFPDNWREIPLAYHLYTEACMTTTGREFSPVNAVRLPFYRKTLILRVSAPQLKANERLGLCGNHPVLGNWNPALCLPLREAGGMDWIISVSLEGIYQPIEYKYVVIDTLTGQTKRWEEGENRSTGDMQVLDGQVYVRYDDALHLSDENWFVAGVVTQRLSRRLVDWSSAMGFRIVKWQPSVSTKVSRRNIAQLIELADYAREKHVALMGVLSIRLDEPLNNHQRWSHRLRLLSRIFSALSVEFIVPYNDESHDDYWSYLAGQRVKMMMQQSRLLICANHVRMPLEYMSPVMRRLRVLTMEIETISRMSGCEFSRIDSNPYCSVDAISAPSMPLLETWWEENPGRTQRYYATVLQHEGKAPRHLTIRIAEEIIARHLFSPSMICLLAEQDLQLLTDERLREMIKRSKR